MTPQTKQELAQFIDHTLLAAESTQEQIQKLCTEATEHKFASVCILPRWVALSAELLQGTGVKVCTVVGFPLGAVSPRIKALETEEAIMAGADEVDMVANLAAVMQGDQKALQKDIEAVAQVCKRFKPPACLKVIIEAAALTDEQIVFACQAAQAAQADYVKTSTGTHKAGGAKIEHVRLMAQTAPFCKIKAAGGIRTAADAMAMIEAGASRIGASASIQILNDFQPNVI